MLKYMKTDPVRKAKAVYSELAIARESATVACIPAEIRKQAGEAKSFKVEKGKLSGVP